MGEVTDPTATELDVLIVGAGLSGIAAAYWLKTECPQKTYAILEARETMGGTWDLFRYPGIRSDSDMYTLGYSFRPWRDPKAIADGPSILRYIQDTAREYGIDRQIRYQSRVIKAAWSSDAARWTVTVKSDASGEVRTYRCKFLFMCSGYYDYAEGYTPELPGADRYRGKLVHPQKWPADLDWTNKRVVVIGSGATAVTLVPELAKTAAHVTMLQRSPTYIFSAPERDRLADWLRERVPEERAHAALRWKNVFLGMGMYAFCRGFPERAKGFFIGQAKKQIGGAVDVADLTPTYGPWDQRLCLVPDGDLFKSLKAGSASIVTDHIETFTEGGLRLRSGKELAADVIVTATGLKLKILGGAELTVDGVRPDLSESLVYKGMMFSGIPNLALAIGYTNASWTLKCELTARWVCRLLNHLDQKHLGVACPRRPAGGVEERPLIDFSSGYVKRALEGLPRQGSRAPWRLYQNYVLDLLTLRHAPIRDEALELRA